MYRKNVLRDESVQPSSFSSHFHTEIHDISESVRGNLGHGNPVYSKDTNDSLALEHKNQSEVKSHMDMQDMSRDSQGNYYKRSEKDTALYQQSSLLPVSSVPTKIQYEYDVLLIYDPEENDYYVERLLEFLEPQKLSIFDFLKESPPGIPQRKFLQHVLEICRYTCIVITRKFITNYWLQLKTDMTIQNMLDKGDKLYSVIGVVMDHAIKREHLPLDLATLSPLFCYEKYFENRMKLAFDSNTRFHMQSWKDKLLPKKLPNFEVSSPSAYEFKPPGKFHPPIEEEFSFTTAHVSPFNNSNIGSQTSSSLKRSPQEHGDNTYILPPSLLTTYHGMDSDLSTGIQRGVSITINSTGCRSPKETLESSDPFSNFHSSLNINAPSTLKETSDHISIRLPQSDSTLYSYAEEYVMMEKDRVSLFSEPVIGNEDSQQCEGNSIENVLLPSTANSYHLMVPSVEYSELEISVNSTHEKLNPGASVSDSNLAIKTYTQDQNILTTSMNLSEDEACAIKQLSDRRESHSLPISLNDDKSQHPKRSHSLLSAARLKLSRLRSRKKKAPK